MNNTFLWQQPVKLFISKINTLIDFQHMPTHGMFKVEPLTRLEICEEFCQMKLVTFTIKLLPEGKR